MSFAPPPDDYDMIFVFGSNLSGIHGGGAARYALDHHGAIWGQAEGPQGRSYALPTKDYDVKTTLSLNQIKGYVFNFLHYAADHPDQKFQVTAVGCGLAGLRVEEVAPFFSPVVLVDRLNPDAASLGSSLKHVLLPPEFREHFSYASDDRFWK